MYSIDRGFLRELKTYDSRLDCQYDPELERFVISYERPFGGSVPVLVVRSEDDGFKRPDRRDLEKLCEGDTHKISVKDRLAKTSYYMEQYRELKRKEAAENIRNMTKDDRRQLANAFGRAAGAGKGNATFRRVDLKKRGKTLDELTSA